MVQTFHMRSALLPHFLSIQHIIVDYKVQCCTFVSLSVIKKLLQDLNTLSLLQGEFVNRELSLVCLLRVKGSQPGSVL